MRWRSDNWHLRLMGCLFGIGALALGLPVLWEDVSVSPSDQAEHFDYAMIATITGLIALIGSLLTPDIRGLWYCNPERSKNARLTPREAAMRQLSNVGPNQRDHTRNNDEP